MVNCWRPSILTSLPWSNYFFSVSLIVSYYLQWKKKKKSDFFFFFFHNQKILSLVSFHRSKNKTKEKNTMQWMSQHFDAWVTCTGNILVMNHTISSMGAFPWGEGGRAIVSQCWKGVQHKTTPMAASLIAHRTSDTEKNNNFKNCRKC